MPPCQQDPVRASLSLLVRLVLEDATQFRDEHMDALRRARRRVRRPELVDEFVDGNDLVRAEQEHGEQLSLLLPAELQLSAVVLDLERSEDSELHALAPPSTRT